MSLLSDITGQVWFLTGACIFVASAISVTILAFVVLHNTNRERGELDQGATTRLDALRTMSLFYIVGGVFGTVTALVIRLLFRPTQAMWSVAGLLYLVVAGLVTAYLIKPARQLAIKEVQMPKAPASELVPAPASAPIEGAESSSSGAVTRVGFMIGYVATVISIIIAVILVGVL